MQRSPPFAIFYNVYIPTTPNGLQNTARIVREQIERVSKSYAASQTHPVQLYYNTVSTNSSLGQQVVNLMKQECAIEDSATKRRAIDCRHGNHFREGHEEVRHASVSPGILRPTSQPARCVPTLQRIPHSRSKERMVAPTHDLGSHK